MNVRITENAELDKNDVIIECKERSSDIEAAAEILRCGGSTVVGSIDGISFIVRLTDILYFESVDKNGFFYTENKVYCTDLRLYEAEEKYKAHHFIRVSKSMVVNMLKIDEISPYLGGKLRLKLVNGEFTVVSRKYAHNIKLELRI